jgi:hypothetical protein
MDSDGLALDNPMTSVIEPAEAQHHVRNSPHGQRARQRKSHVPHIVKEVRHTEAHCNSENNDNEKLHHGNIQLSYIVMNETVLLMGL